MYALNVGHRFPIYWTNNLLSVSRFDYDKLHVFRVVKVKDLLNMVDDLERISNFLGNAYMYLIIL